MAGKTPEFGVLPTRIVEFTTPGSFSYTVPVGVAYLFIKAAGGGGAGGGSTAAGGGGAGGYFEGIFSIPAGTVIPLTIGSRGFPNSGAGTATVVGGPINLTCNGGGGGQTGGSGGVSGGAGGTVTGTIPPNVIAFTGEQGGGGAGQAGVAQEGDGGSGTMYGGGGKQMAFTSGPGSAGSAPGAGGGGGYGSGYQGADGAVIIEEHY